jgi:hypothetical protein
MSEIIEETAAPRKRRLVKTLAIVGGGLVLVAGGVSGGLYAAGYFPGDAAHVRLRPPARSSSPRPSRSASPPAEKAGTTPDRDRPSAKAATDMRPIITR